MVVRYNAEAPVRSAMVDPRSWVPSLRWLQWFQVVGDFVQGRLREAATYDPPALGAGASVTVDVPFAGATDQHVVAGVSFSPMTEAGVPTPFIRVFGNVTAADTVSVTFANFGPGAIDLDAGTIRIIVETNS